MEIRGVVDGYCDDDDCLDGDGDDDDDGGDGDVSILKSQNSDIVKQLFDERAHSADKH